jgi:hypothetical protein
MSKSRNHNEVNSATEKQDEGRPPFGDVQAPMVDLQVRTLPTVARLYYSGLGSRRYKRASVCSGPGEPLCSKSLAEAAIRQEVALAIAKERERWVSALKSTWTRPAISNRTEKPALKPAAPNGIASQLGKERANNPEGA